jgi:SOS-response transcriptional repressor LexA
MSRDLNKKVSTDLKIDLLSKNICFLMQKKNLDSATLHAQSGIPVTTINSLKRGGGNPTLATLQQLCACFHVSISELTESDLSNKVERAKTVVSYEIPLFSLDDLFMYLKDKKRFHQTISTDIENWKEDKYYAIKISNNGMSPLFEKGTIFVIEHDAQTHDGDIVLVQFGSHSPCFRRIFIEGDSFYFKQIADIVGDSVQTSSAFTIHGTLIKAIQYFS